MRPIVKLKGDEMSDVMLLGVLRIPITADSDALTIHQFASRAREAADRIESDAKEIERLRADLENARAEAVLAVNAAVAAERERWAAIARQHEALATDLNGAREAATARSIFDEGFRA